MHNFRNSDSLLNSLKACNNAGKIHILKGVSKFYTFMVWSTYHLVSMTLLDRLRNFVWNFPFVFLLIFSEEHVALSSHKLHFGGCWNSRLHNRFPNTETRSKWLEEKVLWKRWTTVPGKMNIICGHRELSYKESDHWSSEFSIFSADWKRHSSSQTKNVHITCPLKAPRFLEMIWFQGTYTDTALWPSELWCQ